MISGEHVQKPVDVVDEEKAKNMLNINYEVVVELETKKKVATKQKQISESSPEDISKLSTNASPPAEEPVI